MDNIENKDTVVDSDNALTDAAAGVAVADPPEAVPAPAEETAAEAVIAAPEELEKPEDPGDPEGQKKTVAKKTALRVLRDNIWAALCFVAYVGLDLSFRYFYRFVDAKPVTYPPAFFFTVGWALALTAVAYLLPRVARRIYLILTILVYAVLTLVHGVMLNMFGNFFSFSSIGFTGDGMAFLEGDYIVLRKVVIASVIVIVLMMIGSALLVTREKYNWRRVIVFAAMLAVGITSILVSRAQIVSGGDETEEEETAFAWNSYYDVSSDKALYDSFRDSTRCVYLTGLYQYTFRDLYKSMGIFDRIEFDEDYKDIEAYAADKTVAPDAMTGIAKGKNLILIQLEAIDSWMMTEAYMPNTWALRQRSTDFTNYWATVFIQAGTFNSEFITNTGIIPATGTISQRVYTDNTYRYSLANMFRRAGYNAQSFHGSEGTVYNRGVIHPNLGYLRYNSGTDMKMPSYQMDSQLIGAYDMFTSDTDPFFSFIITFSGHGPYNDESQITRDNIEAARKAVAENLDIELDEGELQTYTWAVAHAMETDKFIGELVERLEADGHMDDTVLVLYADHYNYYMINDHLLMRMKNAPDVTMLQNVPCFIYDSDIEPRKIDKVVSSLDILPTIANMFGLDCDLSYFIGNDMYGDEGGYVIFRNYAWYDGEIYCNSSYSGEMTDYIKQMNARVWRESTHCEKILKSNYFATH